jgi:para-aminobenzoate synthetase component 2
VVDAATVPDGFEISARTRDGVIMGLRHRELPMEGVQFHPESIMTVGGKRLLSNFLNRTDDLRAGTVREQAVPVPTRAPGRVATQGPPA